MRPILRAIAFLALGMLSAPAFADKRVALAIGNSAYRHVARLPNPINDAIAIGAALQRLGFDTVTVRHDLGYDALRQELVAFETHATGADIALVYFAGHGIEVDGQNYLIPADARLTRAIAVEGEAIALSLVTRMIAGARKLRLVILDACRNNPFRARLTAETGTQKRSIGRGLSRVEAGENELVVFAAAAGAEADDGPGRHSPFTA
ncbi:MAG: caspase family protein, partial [Hyphomicrobiaceae bacterium]